MDQILWPCRGVAEHAYCPRLFYFMTVEGVFLPSADTERGVGVHRHVDRPSTSVTKRSKSPRSDEIQEEPVDPDRPQTVRSLALTSQKLGLTATLDLTEVDSSSAIPVEYRKGKPQSSNAVRTEPVDEMMEEPPPSSVPVAWPTDRIQLGLQVLLLEEAGYSVPEAYIYYAGAKLRLRISVDDALRQEAVTELAAAKQTAAGERPEPLCNDPKCPKCSLQPICLPDEIYYQQRKAAGIKSENTPAPRRLWPPRDDGIHVVVQRKGCRVGVRGQSIQVIDKDSTLIRTLPLANVESLALLGSVQVSTQALAVFADHQVPVAFLSAAGRLTAMMDPMGPTSSIVRASQVRILDRPEKALNLARAVTIAKIANQRTLLIRNHASLPPHVPSDLKASREAAARASTLDELRGHEGNAAAIYFSHFSGMFKDEAKAISTRFEKRQRRPPPDPINSIISFGYSMLTNECVAALRLASLEPTLGALHSTRPGRPALALDLMEPFRPLIADSVAVMAINRGELTEGHFLDTSAGCVMTAAGRKAFFSVYGRRMDTEVTHPIFGYRLSYRRMLMLHARLIAAWLVGDVPTLEFLTTR